MSDSTDFVDRVALAIWQEREKCFPVRVQRMKPDDWDRANGAWEFVRNEARSAIEMMREPSNAMLLALWQVYHPWGVNAPSPADRPDQWVQMVKEAKAGLNAMIDAALSTTVIMDGRAYRKFIAFPGPVDDGTLRCISCGQIDEEEFHDPAFCPACPPTPSASGGASDDS